VAALANNLSQAFRYGIYSNDDIEEVCNCVKFLDLVTEQKYILVPLFVLLGFIIT
jgi:hypothetical protein